MRKWRIFFVVAFAFLSFTTFCEASSVRVVSTVLTTMQNALSGRLIKVSQFSSEDVIIYYTTFTWPDVTRWGGTHDVVWNWYQNGVLVSSVKRDDMRFDPAPYRIFSSRAASDFGTGQFQIDVLVDRKVMSSVKFIVR